MISIHALLAESDVGQKRFLQKLAISIHALLAESDNSLLTNVVSSADFYPRSPCGERRDVIAVMTDAQSISIHALLAESDDTRSTVCSVISISIHALLAESDHPSLSDTARHTYFYPRSPCGERPFRLARLASRSYFYPRSPCGERHSQKHINGRANQFLSTLSLRRATGSLIMIGGFGADFYPRSPCGERP